MTGQETWTGLQATLLTAIAEAKHVGTSVLLLHTLRESSSPDDGDEHERDLAAIAATTQQTHPEVTIETRIVRGHPDALLVQESVNAAAAVVGRPHRHGVTGWMRSPTPWQSEPIAR